MRPKEQLEDLRREAKESLDSGSLSSFKQTLRFLASAVAICAAVGGGFIALQKFDQAVFVWLVVAVFSLTLLNYFVNEYERILRRSRILRSFVETDLRYELLLESARKERDKLRHENTSLTYKLEAIRTVRFTNRIERLLENEENEESE